MPTNTTPGSYPAPNPAESPYLAFEENKNVTLAETYFQAAKKRIGLLESSIIDIQCLFFASVFERYAFRLANAWAYLQLGCTRLQMYLMSKGQHKSKPAVELNAPTDYLEQRIFWTCYKAERCVLETPESGCRVHF